MTHQGCPGSKMFDFRKDDTATATTDAPAGKTPSQLRQWPVQLHLVSPEAPYFQNADVVLSADCVAFALGSFHNDFLKGKSLAIACPKLDADQEVYVEKIAAWFDQAKINTLTVIIMQVPCCMGLLNLARQAQQQATRKVPIKCVVISLQGEVLKEEWVTA